MKSPRCRWRQALVRLGLLPQAAPAADGADEAGWAAGGAVPDAGAQFDRLLALRLPALAGRSFLEINCGTGLICGFAHAEGATRVVGVDRIAAHIAAAHTTFPDCEFWQGAGPPPDERYDVIVHDLMPAPDTDPSGLIPQLMDRLNADGTLVLDLGVAHGGKAEWKEFRDADGVRRYPTRRLLETALKPYAWKQIGESGRSSDDPVARHVIHVHPRRPTAYLLMLPPAFGKTSVARRLFGAAGIPVVSGDRLINDVLRGSHIVSDVLHRAIVADAPANAAGRVDIGRIVRRLLEAGLAEAYVAAWLPDSPTDFAFEGYVPQEHHKTIVALVDNGGYFTVRLEWSRPRNAPRPIAQSRQAVAKFERVLASRRRAPTAPTEESDQGGG